VSLKCPLKALNEETAAEYMRKEEEKREKLRKMRNDEKIKSDEKLQEKLRKRKEVSRVVLVL
jgi:fatty acid/phospholipid biosynthesis enzyme